MREYEILSVPRSLILHGRTSLLPIRFLLLDNQFLQLLPLPLPLLRELANPHPSPPRDLTRCPRHRVPDPRLNLPIHGTVRGLLGSHNRTYNFLGLKRASI